jgi:DNA-entry nuclease
MNDSNNESMLYYENRLDSWLYNHPNFWLDYKVTPLYTGDELLPRKVKLQYVGLDKDGKLLEIKVGSPKEKTDGKGITTVVLDNYSPNAKIDYATGKATNIIDGQAKAATSTSSSSSQKASTSQRKVYVASKGKSNVYWYDMNNMPKGTNKDNVVTMSEQEAIAAGKERSSKE